MLPIRSCLLAAGALAGATALTWCPSATDPHPACPPARANSARVVLDTVQVFASADGHANEKRTALYIVRLAWRWPPLEREGGYGRVSLGVAAEGGAVVAAYPRSVNDPLPVNPALSVDGPSERFELAPCGPGAFALEPSSQRLGARRHSAWFYWSAEAQEGGILAPGSAHTYALVRVQPAQSRLRLHVRWRMLVGTLLFKRLRSVCQVDGEPLVFDLPLSASRRLPDCLPPES